MNIKSICKILIILMLFNFLAGCSFIKDLTNDNETIANQTSIDEMNIGNRENLMINNGNVYYIDISNENKLYMIDNQFKNKKLISDKYFFTIVNITDKEIYYIQKTMKDEITPLFDLCSVDMNGDNYKLILENVGSTIFLNDKLYYYRETDEEYEENMGYTYRNFCVFDINSKEESIMDEKTTSTGITPVLYKSKIYYVGAGYKFLEYNHDTKEKKELDKGLSFCRYSDDSIYSYKGSSIEKIGISNNAYSETLLESKEIYNIWDMNVTKDYIFFLAEDTKEARNEIYRLNLYRMKKDGSELKKIYFSDYTESITYPVHHIYNLGDKLLLYERLEKNYLSNRNRLQLIDYDGNEIDSSLFNNL